MVKSQGVVESMTAAAGLCALRGRPGPRLEYFFGESTDSELEAARPF